MCKVQYDSAIAQAEEVGQKPGVEKRLRFYSQKISRKAFGIFKKSLNTKFPDNRFKNLISLTELSKEQLFLYDLPETVKDILRNPTAH